MLAELNAVHFFVGEKTLLFRSGFLTNTERMRRNYLCTQGNDLMLSKYIWEYHKNVRNSNENHCNSSSTEEELLQASGWHCLNDR